MYHRRRRRARAHRITHTRKRYTYIYLVLRAQPCYTFLAFLFPHLFHLPALQRTEKSAKRQVASRIASRAKIAENYSCDRIHSGLEMRERKIRRLLQSFEEKSEENCTRKSYKIASPPLSEPGASCNLPSYATK